MPAPATCGRLVLFLLPAISLGMTVGCMDAQYASDKTAPSSGSGEEAVAAISYDGKDFAPEPRQKESGPPSGSDTNVTRQIIYTARLTLVVDDFDSFPDRLAAVTRSSGGYISENNQDRMQGAYRRGRWVVRVPAKSYGGFVEQVSRMGIAESIEEKADDVTEQFVDLEARIASGKKLEEQIIALLEKQDDKIENVLAVERELSRVRTEIELMEGRMRVLKDQVAMSTITIEASQERVFVPEQARTLDSRVSIAWQNAIERLVNFASDAVVWVVGNAFVIAFWLCAFLLLWFGAVRSIYRRWRSPANS